MQSKASKVVVLGTGGTIAGTAADAFDNVGYTAAQLAVTALVRSVPAVSAMALEAEQVAQLDSKDMDFGVWLALATRVAHHLAHSDVCGIVITHGTDTLVETAYFLQRVLAPAKPVVLTGAMRPATSSHADGPQNLLDAVAVAGAIGGRGVVAVFAGRVHGAREVRKVHPYRIDPFSSGDAGPLACVEEGRLRRFRDWPEGIALGLQALPGDAGLWPRVEIVLSHAGASGAIVRSLCAQGVRGIVVAGTGNGSVHHALETALREAAALGVAVLRSTRCGDGCIVDHTDDRHAALPSAGDLTPVKARIELMLQLMSAGS